MKLRLSVLCIPLLTAAAAACPAREIAAADARIALPAGHADIAARGPALWSRSDVVDMDVTGGVLVARRPLVEGNRYVLVLTRNEHGYGLNRPVPVSGFYRAVATAAAPGRPAAGGDGGGLGTRLALFGLLPFAAGYAAAGVRIRRRQRRILASL
jgi:hypothetical protein